MPFISISKPQYDNKRFFTIIVFTFVRKFSAFPNFYTIFHSINNVLPNFIIVNIVTPKVFTFSLIDDILLNFGFLWPWLVIGTSRTVITSGFGGGEFTTTLRKVCTCQKLKFSFLLLEYCKIRECYAVANALTITNMYSLFLYMRGNSRKINRPTKNMTKIVTLLHL